VYAHVTIKINRPKVSKTLADTYGYSTYRRETTP